MYKQIVLSNKRSEEDFSNFYKRIYQKDAGTVNLLKDEIFKEYLLIYKAYSIFVISDNEVARQLFLAYKDCKSSSYVLYCLQDYLDEKFQQGLKDRKGIVTSITRHRMKSLNLREIADIYNDAKRPKHLIKYLAFRIIGI